MSPLDGNMYHNKLFRYMHFKKIKNLNKDATFYKSTIWRYKIKTNNKWMKFDITSHGIHKNGMFYVFIVDFFEER